MYSMKSVVNMQDAGKAVQRGLEPSKFCIDLDTVFSSKSKRSSIDVASSIRPRTSSDTPSGGNGLISAAPQKQKIE